MLSKNQKIVLFSILVALATIFGYFDMLISQNIIPSALFRVKLGLANIVILVIIYRYNAGSSFMAGILKSVFVSLLFANLITFVISLCGTLLSILFMLIIKGVFKNDKSIIIASIVGGFTHPIGQVLGVFLIYRSADIVYANLIYIPIMLIAGVITGAIVGYVAQKTHKTLQKYEG